MSDPSNHPAETQEEAIAEEKDFNEFMAGYTRLLTTTVKLVSSLVMCMDRHPSLRLGQLIVGAMSKAGWEEEGALFSIYDEQLIAALDEF